MAAGRDEGVGEISQDELKKATEAIHLLSRIVFRPHSEGQTPGTSLGEQSGLTCFPGGSKSNSSSDEDFERSSDRRCTTRLLKSADKALQALKGMRCGLEGSSSGSGKRKRRVKAEVSKLFASASGKKARKIEWKHRFVCLAFVGESKVPTSSISKDDLLKAGLGEKLIEFPCLSANAEEMKELIYEVYPKLRQGGGFELCRCLPNSRQLEPLSSAAYSSPGLLKERVGNAKTYIRPLQKDLSLDEVFDLPEGANEMCLKCKSVLPVTSLKEHLRNCCKDKHIDTLSQSSESGSDPELPRVVFDRKELVGHTHNSPVIIDSTSDVEDQLVKEAIQQSMEDSKEIPSTENNLEQQIELYRKDMYDDELILHIDIRRKCLLQDALKEGNKKKFDTRKRLQVTFVGEGAIDYGGPRREFFRLLACEASEYFFQGRTGCKFFVNNVIAIKNRHLFVFGRYVGMSIIQGGNGIPFLAHQVYSYITDGDFFNFEVDLRDIPEGALKFAVEKISSCEDDAELQAAVGIDEISDLIYQMDYTKSLCQATVADKKELVSSLTLYHLMIRVKSCMDQFIDGLKDVKLFSYVQKDPNTWQSLFVNPNAALSADELKQLLVVLYAEDGSSLKAKQVDAYIHFGDFIDDCYDGDIGCTVEDVLVFVSGSSHIPPTGFETTPTLSFISNGGILATASTCDIQLRIPIVHESYESFKEAMLLSVKGHDGFGNT